MAISSIPITLGAGVPILRSCSRMYCLSNSLTCLPVQVCFLSNVFDCHDPAAPPHKEAKPFAVKRIVRKPLQFLLLHLAASGAFDTTHLDLQVNSIVATP